MEHYLFRILGTLSALAGAYFLVDFDKVSIWGNAFLVLLCAYAAVLFAFDAKKAILERQRHFDRNTEKGRLKIAAYLVKQLKSSGSVAIFSRDLTWVREGSSAELVLFEKAKSRELKLFVESHTELAQRLFQAGAEVKFYGRERRNFNPRSRFTVLDVRTSGTTIMVGSPSNGKHVIKHYGKEDHELLDLAMDFVALLESTSRTVR